MIPEIEREKSELARLIYSAERDKSGNYRTVQAKGFQNVPSKIERKIRNCTTSTPANLTGF
jgi:hypothetical protein